MIILFVPFATLLLTLVYTHLVLVATNLKQIPPRSPTSHEKNLHTERNGNSISKTTSKAATTTTRGTYESTLKNPFHLRGPRRALLDLSRPRQGPCPRSPRIPLLPRRLPCAPQPARRRRLHGQLPSWRQGLLHRVKPHSPRWAREGLRGDRTSGSCSGAGAGARDRKMARGVCELTSRNEGGVKTYPRNNSVVQNETKE